MTTADITIYNGSTTTADSSATTSERHPRDTTVSAEAMTNPDPGPSVREEETQECTQSHFIYKDAQSAAIKFKPQNVILFGEPGVGKSSVINLMAGRDVAKTSSRIEGCTRQATEYSFTLSNQMLLHVIDTVGIEESETGVSTSVGAIERAQKLIVSLRNAGGIDLLLFCVKAGRFTASMQRNYHLFTEILCDNRVPLALVITHLEDEEVMENWWQRNEKTFGTYRIYPVAHACVAALPTHVTLHPEKRVQSQRALEKLFHDALTARDPSYMQAIRNRLFTFIVKPISFLTRNKKRKIVTKKLETYCAVPRGEAKRLAKLIVKGKSDTAT